jgi:uncharacterized RmlC-like cupin family protein
MAEREVRFVHPAELTSADHLTPGMHREVAFAQEGVWVGTVRTEPGIVTGWHHHGDYDTFIYVTSGEFRLEWGPGGNRAQAGGPGTFIHVPGRRRPGGGQRGRSRPGLSRFDPAPAARATRPDRGTPLALRG